MTDNLAATRRYASRSSPGSMWSVRCLPRRRLGCRGPARAKGSETAW